MKLEDIGFYTLSDRRASRASAWSELYRCELVLTSRCNFNCPYCRHVGGADMDYWDAKEIVKTWATQRIRNIRFSGGEPTLWSPLVALVEYANSLGIGRIAISTNGSASIDKYFDLVAAGANDFSISLDACCAEDGDRMAGGIKGAFEQVTKTIQWLSAIPSVYVTVGAVLTNENQEYVRSIVEFADSLGVSDIRIIPAAQNGAMLKDAWLSQEYLDKYPILKYRVDNFSSGRPVRGLRDTDSRRCGLVLDDMAVNQGKHYPCIIYMRESGEAIGEVGSNMRTERLNWFNRTDTHCDPICKANCLDVCVDYNNKFREFNGEFK